MNPQHIKDIVPKTLDQMKKEAQMSKTARKVKSRSEALAKLTLARWKERGYEAKDAEDKESILKHLSNVFEQFAEMDSVVTTAIDPRKKKGERLVISFWGPKIVEQVIEMIKSEKTILMTMMEYAAEVCPGKMDEYIRAVVENQEKKKLEILKEDGQE